MVPIRHATTQVGYKEVGPRQGAVVKRKKMGIFVSFALTLAPIDQAQLRITIASKWSIEIRCDMSVSCESSIESSMVSVF